MTPEARFAAVFIDFENTYYHLKNRFTNGADPSDAVVQMIRTLRERLRDVRGEQAIMFHAYADFERIEENAQGQLYLAGVETHNVLGTDHKNAADMRLCIDALDTLYTRQEIRTFVFLAGDRDYIPVIQHLKKHARTVIAAAFRETMSGDLLQNLGQENFIDGKELLTEHLLTLYSDKKPDLSSARPSRPAAPMPMPVTPRGGFTDTLKLEDDQLRIALETMLTHYGNKPEVFLTPYLHKLRNALPSLAEPERRVLITRLEDSGVIRVEKRHGVTNDYSVMVVNWNHPDVRDLHP